MLRRFTAASALPLTLAVQGTALTLLALFSLSDSRPAELRVGTGSLPTPDPSIAGEVQIPRDLARERLPVPRFPIPDNAGAIEAPKPDPEKPKAPIAAGDKLAALRVSSVALAGLVSMDSPTPVPGAPDAIGLNDIGGNSGRAWLGGNSRTSRGAGGFLGPGDAGDGGSGRGGFGIGGRGHGHGDNCTPARGGYIRGARTTPGGSMGPPGDDTPRPPAGGVGFYR
jgi:hypothetical protein